MFPGMDNKITGIRHKLEGMIDAIKTKIKKDIDDELDAVLREIGDVEEECKKVEPAAEVVEVEDEDAKKMTEKLTKIYEIKKQLEQLSELKKKSTF